MILYTQFRAKQSQEQSDICFPHLPLAAVHVAMYSGIFLFCYLLSTVPIHAQNIILGRPTNSSVTASVLVEQNMELYIEYGTQPGTYPNATPTLSNKAGTPEEIELENLQADTKYYYRLRYRNKGATSYQASPEYYFHTQRAAGKSFRFLVEADEHLYDKKGIRSMYMLTLENEAKDSADFLLSLGDIFGDDHTPDQTTSADMDALHKDYRQYLGAVCHSMPFYVCLGNHEGENGYYLKQNPPNNIAVYGTLWRKFYYPNPEPNSFYSGNGAKESHGMDLPQNYYAWTWGDALFIVLDVYRHCDVNEKPQNWDWTLGKEQYDWLKASLENSKAKYKFVFAHHTRGQGRGGVKTAKGCEWGGYEVNKNQWEFDKYRPGWEMPIHQLFVKHGVSIFFQGHDHLYAKEELDGIVYQEVPMPSDSTYQIGMLANADAYTDITRDGTGHLRVNVSPEGVTVDFVRSYLPKDTVSGAHKNREIGYSYSLAKTTDVQDKELLPSQLFRTAYNPLTNSLSVSTNTTEQYERMLYLVDIRGNVVATQGLEAGNTACSFDVSSLARGVYAVRLPQSFNTYTVQMVLVY